MQCAEDPLLDADAHVLVRDLKHELKDWEAEFQKRHGRAANKDDMLQRPEVARKYKKYSKLKKQLIAVSASNGKGDLISKSAVLEMETSSLRPPLKRKPKDMLSTNEEPELDLHEISGQGQDRHHARVNDLTELKNSCSISQITAEATRDGQSNSKVNSSCANKQLDSIVPTLKRRCAGLLLSSRQQGGFNSKPATKSDREHHCASLDLQKPECQSNLESKQDTANKPVADSANNNAEPEEIDYRPLPSLIKQYAPSSSVFSLQPSLPIRNLLVSTCSSTPQSLISSPLLRSLNTMSMSENEPVAGSAGISMPQFKARSGKLVKTTSIPLSVFGGQAAKSSFESDISQGHASDGNEDSSMHRGSADGAVDLDASELVDESDSGDDYKNKFDQVKPVHKKKTTQKRSTRRVKLKPVDKEGNVSGTGHSRAPGSQNLVSNNFYKVRLKSSRRGPKSSEERRTALYKRMVGKK